MGEFGMGGGPGSGGGMRGGRGGGQMQEMSGETSAIPAQPSMPEGFPPEMVEAADRQQSAMQPVILLAGSVALLLAALLFAWRYPFKR